MGPAFLRKYATGTGADIYVPLVKRGVVDFAVGADYTVSAGDVKISIDGGAAANIGTLPVAVAMGNGAYWQFVFANAELTGKSMIVTIADSATKAVEDQAFIIETFGHASAMYQADFSLANLPANVTQLLGTAWLTPAVAGTPQVDLINAPNSTALVAMALAVWVKELSGAAIATNSAGWHLRFGTVLNFGAIVGVGSTTTSIVLANGPAVGNCADQLCTVIYADGSIESSPITSYTPGTMTLSLSEALPAVPQATVDVVIVTARHIHSLTATAAAIWNALTSGITTSGSIGKRILDLISGMTSLAQWLGAGFGKQTANATALSEINATGAGSGTFAGGASDSLEAIRDRGDAAWITATGFSTLDAAGVRTAVGMTSADMDTQLDAILAAASVSSGAGVYAVTITVNDGTAVIQGATVTLAINNSRYTATTNASGVAVLSPDEGAQTYNVRIAANGYQFTPVNLVVTGDQSQTYSMTANTTPSDSGRTTCYLTVQTMAGVAASGIDVTLQYVDFERTATGEGVSVPSVTTATNSSGYVEFLNIHREAKCRVRVGEGPWQAFTTADAATTPMLNAMGKITV